MLTPSPIKSALRETARVSKLGADAVCVLCGETDGRVLIVDQHHVAGRVNDPELMAAVCRNCHARQTEELRQIGVPMRYGSYHGEAADPTPLDRLCAVLAGAGMFLAELGATLVGWARWLTEMVAALDSGVPSWRTVVSGMPDVRVFVPAVLP